MASPRSIVSWWRPDPAGHRSEDCLLRRAVHCGLGSGFPAGYSRSGSGSAKSLAARLTWLDDRLSSNVTGGDAFDIHLRHGQHDSAAGAPSALGLGGKKAPHDRGLGNLEPHRTAAAAAQEPQLGPAEPYPPSRGLSHTSPLAAARRGPPARGEAKFQTSRYAIRAFHHRPCSAVSPSIAGRRLESALESYPWFLVAS